MIHEQTLLYIVEIFLTYYSKETCCLTGEVDQSGQKVQKLSYLQWIWGGLSVNTQPCNIATSISGDQNYGLRYKSGVGSNIQTWYGKYCLKMAAPGRKGSGRLHILPREFPWYWNATAAVILFSINKSWVNVSVDERIRKYLWCWLEIFNWYIRYILCHIPI